MKKNVTKFIWFPEAIKNFFVKCIDYRGTATRAEFWWSRLFVVLSIFVCVLLFDATPNVMDVILSAVGADKLLEVRMVLSIICLIFLIVIMLASITITIRRMHDIGISGWWWFCLFFISFLLSQTVSGVAAVLFSLCFSFIDIIFLCYPSVYENNKYRNNQAVVKKVSSRFVLEEDDD